MDLSLLLQLLVNGIVLGFIYALISMGLSLIFGVIGIVNFAHGEFYMLGAMLCFYAFTYLGMSYWISAAFVLIASLAFGYLLYVTLLDKLAGKGFERNILLTLGLAMILQNGAMLLFTTEPRMLVTGATYSEIEFGDVVLPLVRLQALVLAVCAFLALYAVLYRTRAGQAMRGVAQSRSASLMVGIDPRRISALAVVVGVGLSGIAGAALAPVYSIHPSMGAAFIFKAFAVVIVGGLGNVGGAAIAAIGLGIVETISTGLLPLAFVDAIAFVAMMLVLLVRPEGLFGRGMRV